jgi:hypothetical protein
MREDGSGRGPIPAPDSGPDPGRVAGAYMVGDGQSAADRLDLGRALVPRPEEGIVRCAASQGRLSKMKAVAASLEGRHRAPRGLTEPRGPTRGVGACARSIRYVQAVGPGPGVGPAALAAHRRGQGQPLPHPPRQDEDRCSRPGVPLRKRASRGCPPGGAGLRFRPALIPLFREGEHVSASNAICTYKSPSRPCPCRRAPRRGIRPPVAGLRALVRGACRRRTRGVLAAVIGSG